MNHITRKNVMATFFDFLNALPYVGGQLPATLGCQWQMNAITLHHAALNGALDPDGSKCIAGFHIVATPHLPDGVYQLNLFVRKP